MHWHPLRDALASAVACSPEQIRTTLYTVNIILHPVKYSDLAPGLGLQVFFHDYDMRYPSDLPNVLSEYRAAPGPKLFILPEVDRLGGQVG